MSIVENEDFLDSVVEDIHKLAENLERLNIVELMVAVQIMSSSFNEVFEGTNFYIVLSEGKMESFKEFLQKQ